MSEGQLGEDYRSCKDIMIRPWAVYRCQEDKTVRLFRLLSTPVLGSLLLSSVSRPIRPCGAHLRWSDGETEDEREERGTHALPLSLRPFVSRVPTVLSLHSRPK